MIVSPDDHVYNDEGIYEWTPDRVTYAWWVTKSLVKEFLEAYETIYLLVGIPGSGKSTWLYSRNHDQGLYVDATFSRRKERRDFIAWIRSMDPSKKIVAVVFNTPLEICLQRNSERTEDRKVPVENLMKMHSRFRGVAVSLDEGFNEILQIS